jgi:hypothetical protein
MEELILAIFVQMATHRRQKLHPLALAARQDFFLKDNQVKTTQDVWDATQVFSKILSARRNVDIALLATKLESKHHHATDALWGSIRIKQMRRRVKIVIQEGIKSRTEHSSALFVKQGKKLVLLLKFATNAYTASTLQSSSKRNVLRVLLVFFNRQLENRAARRVKLESSR